VLCGELEVQDALIGFSRTTPPRSSLGRRRPVAKLIELIGKNSTVFAEELRGALPEHTRLLPVAAGRVYRFKQ